MIFQCAIIFPDLGVDSHAKIQKVLEKFEKELNTTNERLKWEKTITIAMGYEVHKNKIQEVLKR